VPRGSPLSGWRERAFGETQAAALENAGYPRLLARLLAARGVTAETAAAYFSPSLADLSSPGDLPGIETAVREILSSLARGERIVVFGDYDCDGVCATAIVMAALGVLARPDAPPPQAFLPERLTEGYGMSAASVARLLDENPDVRLIVTVDNGINAVSAVTELAARGIKVVVTDHHLPGEELPAAAALVNPKVSAPPRLEGLCGAGVAFLLAKALVTAAKERGLYAGPPVGGPLLVLAGLATVTDVMPVTGENRILVSEALRRFRTWAPMGLKELFLRVSRSAAATLVTKDFSFLIGPRINAAGRLASGMDALNLILTTDREEARELARQVDLRNIERKSIE
jgi:single-stranded-DNA-specific exonuclease